MSTATKRIKKQWAAGRHFLVVSGRNEFWHAQNTQQLSTLGRGESTSKILVYQPGSALQVSLCQSLNAVFMVFGPLHFVVCCNIHHKRRADQEASSMQPWGMNVRPRLK